MLTYIDFTPLLLACVCVGGAQFLKKACTKSKDTECDCRAGFRCGDDHCSFCVEECGKGQEPLPAARKTHISTCRHSSQTSYLACVVRHKIRTHGKMFTKSQPLHVCLHRVLPELSRWDLQWQNPWEVQVLENKVRFNPPFKLWVCVNIGVTDSTNAIA